MNHPPSPRTPVFILVCIALLTGCSPTPEPETHEYTIIALGTIINLELVTDDEQLAHQAFTELQALFNELGRDWYAFGDGELGRVNAALAGGGKVKTTPELSTLIARSLVYRTLSNGLFDPTLGRLIQLWGFADFDTRIGTFSPPTDAAIDGWLDNRTSRQNVSVNGQTIRSTGPVMFDLGGVAKGTVLTRASALLEQLGIHDAMIDAGGDISVIGLHGQRPWRAGIRNPYADNIIAAVALEPGEAVVTSGNYERYFNHDGHRYSHVLNPRTGKPVERTAAVTVIHTNPELADAAATALMVAGPDRFDEITRRMRITAAMLIDTHGELIMTPAMARRMVMTAAQE